jgi:hypothetical protein
MIEGQKATVGLNKGTAGAGDKNVGKSTGGVRKTLPVKDALPTLDEAGIDKNLAKRARKAVHVLTSQIPEQAQRSRLARCEPHQ